MREEHRISSVARYVILLLAAQLAQAQTAGLKVTPADGEQFAHRPPDVVSVTFSVDNDTSRPLDIEPHLILPPDWRAVTPDLPFHLAAGAGAVRLISFVVPDTARAAEYSVTYEVRDRNAPSLSASSSVRVRVLPAQKLQVRALETPDQMIAGERYRAVFVVRNVGNAQVAAVFGAHDSGNSQLDPRTGTLQIEPGGSTNVVLDVIAAEVSRRTEEVLTLTVEVQDTQIGDSASTATQIVPRVSTEHAYRTLSTYMGLAFVARERTEERTSGWQLDWSGSGALDDAGSRYVNFKLRGPDVRSRGSLGPMDEYVIQYRDDTLSAALGDDIFGLSFLTEPGRYARGVEVAYGREDWGLSGYRARDRFDSRGAEQTAFSAHYKPTTDTRVDLNLFDESGALPTTIQSVRGQASWHRGLSTDLEIAHSDSGEERGMAYRGSLYGGNTALRYYALGWHADPAYRGYLRDEAYLTAGFDYSPSELWGWRSYYRLQEQNLAADPVRPAIEEHEVSVGATRTLFSALRTSIDLKVQTRSERFIDPERDIAGRAVRIGVGRSFENVSLHYSLERGTARDRGTPGTMDTSVHVLSAYWRASPAQSYALYALREDSVFVDEPETSQASFGMSASYNLRTGTSFTLDAQHNRAQENSYASFNATLFHELRNGARLSMVARRLGGRLPQSDVLLTYTVPFDMPIFRRANVGAVHGRVFDGETGVGLKNVVLNLDGLTAVSDAQGEFQFPAVPAGSYQLSMDRANLDVGKVPTGDLPLAITVVPRDSRRMEIPLASSVALRATVKIGSGGAGSGVQSVLITLRRGRQVYRRLTDADGSVRIAGLPPGEWIVSVAADAIPQGYELLQMEEIATIPSGGATTIDFVLTPIRRDLKMLPALKIR